MGAVATADLVAFRLSYGNVGKRATDPLASLLQHHQSPAPTNQGVALLPSYRAELPRVLSPPLPFLKQSGHGHARATTSLSSFHSTPLLFSCLNLNREVLADICVAYFSTRKSLDIGNPLFWGNLCSLSNTPFPAFYFYRLG